MSLVVKCFIYCSFPLPTYPFPQRCIINNTHRLVELCVAKLSQDWFPLLELLAMATNPHCKFHIYNGTRPSETVPAGAQLADDELSARPPDPRSPKVNNHCNFQPYMKIVFEAHHRLSFIFILSIGFFFFF